MSNSNQGWSSQAHSQSNLSSRNLDNTLPDLKKYLVDGLRVLDVGCGPGTITLDIALRNRSIYVHGIDADQGMMSSAIANACDLGLQGVHFTRADATALPFADDTFDLVFSNAVIDWIEQPEKVLQEKARVTAPGGSVFTRVSDLASRVAYPTCENSDKVLWAMERMINGSEEYCGWNPFLARRMNHLFRKAGLLDIQITGWTRLSFGGNAPKPNEVLPGSSLVVACSRCRPALCECEKKKNRQRLKAHFLNLKPCPNQ